jgi:hypothetical protein
MKIPKNVKTIPLIRTVEAETRPLGKGRPLVRSIIASISLSKYMFNTVAPETARNNERSKNPKSNQLKG